MKIEDAVNDALKEVTDLIDYEEWKLVIFLRGRPFFMGELCMQLGHEPPKQIALKDDLCRMTVYRKRMDRSTMTVFYEEKN